MKSIPLNSVVTEIHLGRETEVDHTSWQVRAAEVIYLVLPHTPNKQSARHSGPVGAMCHMERLPQAPTTSNLNKQEANVYWISYRYQQYLQVNIEFLDYW